MAERAREFAQLLEQARAGSEAAFRNLVDNYSQHVLRAVRRKLRKHMRSTFDSNDFVQDVWKTFFDNRERILWLNSPVELLAVLTQVAYHKVIDEARERIEAKSGNASHEISLDRGNLKDLLHSPTPTPIHIVMAKESWEQALAESQICNRQMVELAGQGESSAEISEKQNVTERAVRRVLQRARLRASR